MPTIINTQSIITVPQIESIATDGSSTIYVNEDKKQLRQIPVNKFLDSIKQKICDTIYPIGAIYMSTSPTSPATLFGGTWERIEGRFLVGAGSAYSAGSTGGSANAVVVSHSHTGANHSHTINSHTHGINSHNHSIGNHTHAISLTSGNASQGHTHSFSGSSSHTHAFSNGGVALTVGSRNENWGEEGSSNRGIERADPGRGWWWKQNKSTGSITDTTVTISGTTGGQSQSHTHKVTGDTGATVSGNTGGRALTTNGSGTLTTNKAGTNATGTTGQSGTGKNLPPYVAVYMWKRVS